LDLNLTLTDAENLREQFEKLWGDGETIIRSSNPLFDEAIPIKQPITSNQSKYEQESLDTLENDEQSADTTRTESQNRRFFKQQGHKAVRRNRLRAVKVLQTNPAEEASRPYYQFTQQLKDERQRMLMDSSGRWHLASPDINTKAADTIKESWKLQGIWNDRWGTYPGMTWMHEKAQTMEDDSTRKEGLGNFLATFVSKHKHP
jgi:hypothetical protein